MNTAGLTYEPFLFVIPGTLLFFWFGRYVWEALSRADSMLETLYRYHRREWLEAGAPKGWTWPESNRQFSFGGDLISHATKWDSQRPKWADLDDDFTKDFDRWLYCYRKIPVWFAATVATWGAGFIALVVYLIAR